jgi:hypothetical protein
MRILVLALELKERGALRRRDRESGSISQGTHEVLGPEDVVVPVNKELDDVELSKLRVIGGEIRQAWRVEGNDPNPVSREEVDDLAEFVTQE